MTEGHDAAEVAWGDHEPEPFAWRFGLWELELRGDEVADVRFDGVLVVRSIRGVIRDRDWDTVPSSVVDVTAAHDRLTIALRHAGLGADFDGSLTISVRGDELRAELGLTARRDFERNRLGLIVLHPPTLAGAALTVIHTTGGSTATSFPLEISPHQPAFDIAGLAFELDGVAVDLGFEGEAFEMEDQRNWTDASYKTYSTPLSEPFPVLVPAGTTVRHGLRVAAHRVAASPAPSHTVPSLVETGALVPLFGVGASTGPEPLPEVLPLASFVVVEPVACTANWRRALDRAAVESRGLPLDVRIVADDPSDVAEIVAAVLELVHPIARLGVFSPSSQVTERAAWTALVDAAADLEAELVGGARSHFTELNRCHGDLPADLPSLTFASTPQMHATGRAQLVESIAIQRLTAEQAVRIADGRPVHVGPVTLRSRFNAVATTPPPTEPRDLRTGYGPARVLSATDPRQESSALAAWTIASAAAFAIPGVATITSFESTGRRGVRDAAGKPFPVAEAVTWLHQLSGLPLLEARDLPRGIHALGARTDDGVVLLIASLRAEPSRFVIHVDRRAHEIELGAFEAKRLSL